MKRVFLLGTIVLALVVLTGCIAGPNELANTPDEDGNVAGFWQGLWNGIIAPFTFVVSLFVDSVSMYELHNNGGWYNFGFLLGLACFWGGSGGGAASRRRAKRRQEDVPDQERTE